MVQLKKIKMTLEILKLKKLIRHILPPLKPYILYETIFH